MADIASKCKITCNLYNEKDKPVFNPKSKLDSNYEQLNLSLNTVILDYDYRNRIMPIIYVKLSPNMNIFDKLLHHSETGTFYLKIQTFDPHTDVPLYKTIIEEKFMYFIPSNYNYTSDMKLDKLNREEQGMSVVLGLLKLELINNNKTIFNGVYKNTSNKKLIKLFTKHLGKTYIDKITNDEKYDTFLLTPQTSVKDALAMLFDYSVEILFKGESHLF